MIIYIAGINHFDPLCRIELKAYLECLRNENIEPPAFIAVEYGEDNFKKIEGHRPEFRKMLLKKWPDLNSNLLDIFTASLGYEGDVHKEVFPDAEILWLDERQDKEDAIRNYAQSRLRIYHDFLKGIDICNGHETVLKKLRNEARNSAKHGNFDKGRSSKFAKLIMKRIKKGISNKWAVVIVGSNHASEEQGTMRSILENYEYECIVTDLS